MRSGVSRVRFGRELGHVVKDRVFGYYPELINTISRMRDRIDGGGTTGLHELVRWGAQVKFRGKLALVIVALTGPSMSSCCSRNPATALAARNAFARYEPVVQALQRYLAEKGESPTQLRDLVPQYLSAIPKPIEGDDSTYLNYEPTRNGYRLRFNFADSCMSECIRENGRGWHCVAYQ